MSENGMRRRQDFARFYYSKVALGEGCGCAERIIDAHEFDRRAGRADPGAPLIALPRRGAFRRFLFKAGLKSRPASR